MPRTATKPKPADIPLPPEWPDDDEDVPIEDRMPPAGTYNPIAAPDALIEGVVIEEPVTALTVIRPNPQQHLIVGLGALAALSEQEFEQKLNLLVQGQERLEIIVKRLLKSGEDYGRVKGIEKPFLHLPGAEKLEKFYGYAVRQEAERVVGDGVTAPPFGYHVRSFIHLGDLDGPVIDQGYGEANVWEDKYRYHWVNPTCPECGRPDLIRRKNPPNLEGKLQCPAWGGKGGCNRIFEPNDPRIKPSHREENDNPWSQAETILLMASKRSFVHGIRRATGTSGYFTQDEDAPSVQQQAAESGETSDAQSPVIEAATIGIPVGVGARTEEATQVQFDRLFALAKEKGLGGAKIAGLLNRLFGLEVEPNGKAATAAVKTLTADQLGSLIQTVETGEVPEDLVTVDAAASDTAQAIAAGQPLGG